MTDTRKSDSMPKVSGKVLHRQAWLAQQGGQADL